MVILVVLYAALGYWACGKTIYANKIRIGDGNTLFMNRLFNGILLGWILIPIALIRVIFGI